MENIFDLKSYRHYLETFYVYDIDKDTYLKRKKEIDSLSDEYLQTIIDNTKKLCKYIINKIKVENKVLSDDVFTSIEIYNENNYAFINNNCDGGFPCDQLYTPVEFGENFWVSMHLLKEFFKNFHIEITNDIHDTNNHVININSSKEDYENIYNNNVLVKR